MDQDLRVPFHTLIELIIRLLSLINSNVMAHNEARLCFARDNQVSEVSLDSVSKTSTCIGRQRRYGYKDVSERARTPKRRGIGFS